MSRAPARTREKTSRPRRSVPNQNSPSGEASLLRGILRRHRFAEERAEDPEEENDAADQERLRAKDEAEPLAARDPGLVDRRPGDLLRDDEGVWRGGHSAAAYRMRGLRSE